MNQLHAMRAFVEVAERGSFARAAHALHLSTGTVSSQIATLESHLGVTLLNRTTRRISLTDAGSRYFDVCRSVLSSIDQAERTLGQSGTSAAGLLRVEAPYPIASSVLLPILPEFQARFPQVALHLHQSEHMFDTAQMGFDVMFRTCLEPLADSALIARPIKATRSILAAAPGYLQRHGRPESPNDLRAHQCIGFIDPLTRRLWEWFFEADGHRFSMELDFRLAFSEGELRADAALRELGIINALERDIAPLLASGQLVEILSGWAFDAPPTFILYPRRRHKAAALEAFVEFVLEKHPAHDGTATFLSPSRVPRQGGSAPLAAGRRNR
ncbi:MAG: LysR substrate-binding domain-containing protein [Gammaproteobacteria bacterium]